MIVFCALAKEDVYNTDDSNFILWKLELLASLFMIKDVIPCIIEIITYQTMETITVCRKYLNLNQAFLVCYLIVTLFYNSFESCTKITLILYFLIIIEHHILKIMLETSFIILFIIADTCIFVLQLHYINELRINERCLCVTLFMINRLFTRFNYLMV